MIVIVRHGESAKNVLKTEPFAGDVLPGVADHLVPLTTTGRKQASVTGLYLVLTDPVGFQFDLVYHSGYQRAHDTAVIMMNTLRIRDKVELREDWRLREREPGHTSNMTREEADTHFPYLQTHWDREGPARGVPPGGESMMQVREAGIRDGIQPYDNIQLPGHGSRAFISERT